MIRAFGERFGVDQARAAVHEDRGRLVLRLWASSWAIRQELIADLRRTFPGHHDRCWRATQGVWSFPLRHRAMLLAWVFTWLEPDAIAWTAPATTTPERITP